MIVRKLRLQRAWSQEQLAQFSGLSIRTIQRIERGQNAGLESLKSLAAVFEIELSELNPLNAQKQESNEMTELSVNQSNVVLTIEEQRAIEQVKDIKGFYSNLISFALFIPALFILNWYVSPSYYWAWWAVMGWSIGIISHALSIFEVFNFFGADWEKKQIEKRLGRKL